MRQVTINDLSTEISLSDDVMKRTVGGNPGPVGGKGNEKDTYIVEGPIGAGHGTESKRDIKDLLWTDEKGNTWCHFPTWKP